MIPFLPCKDVCLFRALLWDETQVPPVFFERPLWSGNESLLAFLERPPWSKKYQDSASLTWLSLEARKTLCVREMALRARRRCERRCASVKWYFVPTVRREMSPRWLS